ncbi:hypothetical protein GTO27_02115, partial [Candidatus Bathyarchaeota archaeon]|nr:hypothetical protein [Candidatus Bathyarchaeota archaeon]
MSKKWLEAFLPLYKREIGLPFSCNARANILKEDVVALLKESGCDLVNMAIETGNEHLRRTILKKDIT